MDERHGVRSGSASWPDALHSTVVKVGDGLREAVVRALKALLGARSRVCWLFVAGGSARMGSDCG